MIAFGCLDHQARRLRPRPPGPGIRRRGRAGQRGPRLQRDRVDLPLLQPAHGEGGRARRPRGARARPPGRRDRRPGLLREAARGARRPRGRRRRLRRRDRRAQHRLVGGLGHLGVVHAPLRRARRRRGRLVLLEPGRDARVRAHGRGRHRSTASCSASRRGRSATSASTSRSASSTATTSTSASRSREAGKKVVTADLKVDPPPLARARQRPGDVDPGPHEGRREVGRAGCPEIGYAVGDWKRARAPRGGRRRAQPPAGRRRCSSSTRPSCA